MISEIKKIAKKTLIKSLMAVNIPIDFVYKLYVLNVAKIWGKQGMHPVIIGSFVAGEEKVRSFYREDILLRTILFFIDLKGKSCLDLACNDGFWAFKIGRFGIKKLVGIDRDETFIDWANFLKKVYNFSQYEFHCCDIFDFLERKRTENYDIVLLLSILYHLPSDSNWNDFFSKIAQLNNYCLIVDTRVFDNDDFWYDRESGQAVIQTKHGAVKKWRLKRSELFSYLLENGYEQLMEVNPSCFLKDKKAALGNADPYVLDNACDYITGNRSVIIAYKSKSTIPDIEMSVNYVDAEGIYEEKIKRHDKVGI